MCGIAGSINLPFNTDIVNTIMGHRGPDHNASYQYENLLLHHLRLSIVDIDGGAQPMHYKQRYTIIFNGEIYNHNQIRTQLSLNCITKSDTETILHAWHLLGPRCLTLFDGMFAFALFDKEKNELYLVRDRAGKKPLHIYNNGQSIFFASELNAIKAVAPLQIDEESIGFYFRLGACYRSRTPYKNVEELLNGHYIKLNITTLEQEKVKWWDIQDYYRKPIKIDDNSAINNVEEILNEAVRRRIDSSDLEVGAFLSGGIDSGLIVAMAAKHSTKLKTFTVKFEGQFDESHLAEKVAKKYETVHQTLSINFDHLKYDLETILKNYGEPFFDSSAIPSFYVAQAAKKHVTVILNGDGADELFGGYRRFVPFAQYNFFNAPTYLRSASRILTNVIPPSHNKKSFYNYIYRLLSFAGKQNNELFLAAGPDIFEGFENYLVPGLQSRDSNELSLILSNLNNNELSGLRQMMLSDFEVNLFSDLLVKMDIATMSHSLEGRSPMLCKEFLELIPSLPDNLKIRGGTTKYILRTLAKKLLPPEIAVQPKRGFEIPLKKWVNNDLKEIISDYLLAPNSYHTQYFNKNISNLLLSNKLRVSEEKRAKMIWSIFCLEVWYKKVYTR